MSKNKENKRKLQIGVMGSAADLNYDKSIEKTAKEIGYWIAKNGAILMFGAEKDHDTPWEENKKQKNFFFF